MFTGDDFNYPELILGDEFGYSDALLGIFDAIAGLAAAAVFGVATLIDFNTTFRIFHEVVFRNDFWKLNPSQSNLLRLFPEGFWFSATLVLVVVTALQVAGVYAVAWWASHRSRVSV